MIVQGFKEVHRYDRPVLAGKDRGKFRWLARKQAPRVAVARGAEM